MGTLKIGSAKNMVGVTINPSVVLFNGDNVKRIKSGLTEIWSNIKALVPVMTSNTTPYGEAKCSNYYEVKYDAYRVFGGNQNVDTEFSWITAGNVNANQWVQYKFISPAIVTKVKFRTSWQNQGIPKNIKIQASNDGSTFDTIYEVLNTKDTVKTDVEFEFNNERAYLYWRFYIVDSYVGDYNRTGLASLQFYGSQLKGLIPTMYGNTIPSGEVIYSGYYNYTEVNYPYYAFDGNNDTFWFDGDGGNSTYIGYKFTKKVCAKSVYLRGMGYTNSNINYTLTVQASNDNNEWDNIHVFNFTDNMTVIEKIAELNNDKGYLYYRVVSTNTTNNAKSFCIHTLQFY